MTITAPNIKDRDILGLCPQTTQLSRPALKKRLSGPPRFQKLAPLTSKNASPLKSHQRGTHSRASSRGSITASNWSDDESGLMAAPTFLQYCAFCEKQIEVPDSSILYCSEKCRKQDTQSAQTYELFTRDAPTPFPPSTRSRSQPDLPIHDIIPQLSPSVFIRPTINSRLSEFMGLSEHRVGDAFDHHPDGTDKDLEATHRFYDSKPSTVATPALSTASTSLSTTAGTQAYSPPAYQVRPSNRHWGTAQSTKSVDLVIPVTLPHKITTTSLSAKPIDEKRRKSEGVIAVSKQYYGNDLPLYEKRKGIKSLDVSSETGSLKQLFSPL